MKKGQKIIGISGIILAISVASVACQKNTETEKVVVNETRSTMEYVEMIETEESESEKKETDETKIEKKETENKKKETKTTDKKSDSNKKEVGDKGTSPKNEKETSEQKETQKTVTGSNKPQKPAGTQKPSKPTETQKPSKPAETKPQKPAETQPTRPSETQPVEPPHPQRPQEPEKPVETQHQHHWVEQTKEIKHDAEGHYETVIIEEAWDEPIYKATNICSVCQIDLGSTDNAGLHSAETGHGYYVGDFQVGTKHHDAVTEQKWVEDKAAWKETVVIGYKCNSCNETKK